MRLNLRKNVGFTLMELMVVVTIVGILIMVAMPIYQQQVLKTRRSLGKGELLSVLARQEQFYANNKQYAASLDLLGYVADPYAIDTQGNDIAVTAAQRIYKVQLTSATKNGFTVTAIPQLGQVRDLRCGSLEITSTGRKAASTGAVEKCW